MRGNGERMLPRKAVAAIHPRLAVVAHDMLMVWLAWTAVSMMRWSLAPNPSPVSLFGNEVWLVLAAQGAIFWWTGLYKGLWRFASLPDLWNIAKAAVLGALAITLAVLADRRSRRLRQQAALPPDRTIPRLAEDAVPMYVSGEEANTPRGADAAMSPEEHERLLSAATSSSRLASGWADPRFVTHRSLGWAVLHDAMVVVVDAVGSVRELLPLVEKATAAGKPLVVVTGSIDPDALDTLAVNVVQRHREALVVTHPAEDLRAAALDLGVDVLGRTSLQAGWAPPTMFAHVGDWVSSKDSSWHLVVAEDQAADK